MTEKRVLMCHLHDYIEVACLRAYRLRMELTNGCTQVGVARTTGFEFEDGVKTEVLYFQKDGANSDTFIALSDVCSVEPLDSGAEFGRVDFLVGD